MLHQMVQWLSRRGQGRDGGRKARQRRERREGGRRTFTRLLGIEPVEHPALSALVGLLDPSSAAGGRHRMLPGSRRLLGETLEDRRLLTTYTVANLLDSGAGSLRQAILDSNSNAGSDTINFQSGLSGTITLNSDMNKIADGLTITGPGAAQLTVSGNAKARPFWIDSGKTVAISGLTITKGKQTLGGGIYNQGTLTVSDCIITENNATDYGGGIYSAPGSTLTVNNSTVSGNVAGKFGGGIWIDGTLTVTKSTVSGNKATAKNCGGIGATGTVTVTNSTITGNSAPQAQAGGIGAGGGTQGAPSR